MSKDIVQKRRNEIAGTTGEQDVEILAPVKKATPFFSFRYSYKSISSHGGKTHIRSKEKRFENGKLESEEFEGTLDHNVYLSMSGQIQKHFFDQMKTFMKIFAMFLPGSKTPDSSKSGLKSSNKK